jgi:hypothetical protein
VVELPKTSFSYFSSSRASSAEKKQQERKDGTLDQLGEQKIN